MRRLCVSKHISTTAIVGVLLTNASFAQANDCDYIDAVRESSLNRFSTIKTGASADGKTKVILSLPQARTCFVDDDTELSEYICQWVYSGEAADNDRIRKMYSDFQAEILSCYPEKQTVSTRPDRKGGEAWTINDPVADDSSIERSIKLSYSYFSHAWTLSFSYSYYKAVKK